MGKILRIGKVIEITGRSRSSIYRGTDDGTFPRPVKIGLRSVGWYESDIQAWMNGLTRT